MIPLRTLAGWILGLVLLLGAGFLWVHRSRSPRTPAFARLVISLDTEAWQGVTPQQQRGLSLLLKDRLELACPFPVLLAESLRGTPAGDTSFLRLRGQRIADELQLSARLEGPAGGRDLSLPATAPAAALEGILAQVAHRDLPGASLVPASPTVFWELAGLMGWTMDQEVQPFRERALALVQRVPECPSAWLLLAELDWRTLILTSASDPALQERCWERFQKALEILPNFPRAAYNASLLKTDTGNQREAIETLLKAIRMYPHIPSLRHGLAYAARTVGLLEGSRRALLARDRLQGPSRAGRKIAENTYLYLGDWTTFEESLGTGPDPYVDEVVEFYRGYIRLIRGDREGAQFWFGRVVARQGTKTDFEALAKVFQGALQHRLPEARQTLDRLQSQRLRLRVPDGEFTFKLAEAYAFLGAPDQAMVMAERAFGQGFACTPWFEASPLLAPLREMPRWRSLHQHLLDRQRLLEDRFPPSAFD